MHTRITNLKTTQKLTNKSITITINIKAKTNTAQNKTKIITQAKTKRPCNHYKTFIYICLNNRVK